MSGGPDKPDITERLDGALQGLAALEGVEPYDPEAVVRKMNLANALADNGFLSDVLTAADLAQKKIEVAELGGRVAMAGGDEETAVKMAKLAELHQATLDVVQPSNAAKAKAAKPASTSKTRTGEAKKSPKVPRSTSPKKK